MRLFIKRTILFFSYVAVTPLIFLYKICSLKNHNKSLFSSIGQSLALIPGKVGSLIRVAFYSWLLPGFSSKSHIEFGTFFSHPDVVVHQGVYIGAYCIIGKCEIGEQTLVGSFVNILSGNRQHNFHDIDQPLQAQGGEFVRITIGANCWIGNNAIVMKDIGNRAIIGAGSVVVKQIPEYSVAVGNPCKVIKDLRKNPRDH